jgi:hypothetical protein
LLAQLRRPKRRIAGIQQTSLIAFALALAGAAGERWWYLLLALHPARQMFLAWGRHPEPTMLRGSRPAANT